MMTFEQRWHIAGLLCLLLLTGCRKDDDVVMPTVNTVQAGSGITGDTIRTDSTITVTEYRGLYVLCEGNMGSNKATLDYLDLQSGQYYQNIFPSRNPHQVKELGDVGNDCMIYGSRLWLVVNCSNKVEVCAAETARSYGHVDIPNCRFLAFHEGYAYVSSYVGPVGGTSVQGSVCKVDTASLVIQGQVSVGYQPEEMAVVDGKLYVANSGGYNVLEGKGYDRRLSVIDLKSFTVEREIEVAPNLWRVRADRYGQLWVTSRGNRSTRPGQLFLLTPNKESGLMEVTKTFNLPVTDMAFRGDSLCYIGVDDTHEEADYYCSGVIDLRTHETVSNEFIRGIGQLETPYGLMVHPLTGEVYVMDATNYVSNGLLICYDAAGRQEKWRVFTGDIPGHACWDIRTKTTNIKK